MTNNLRILIVLLLTVVAALVLSRPVATAFANLQATNDNITGMKQQNQVCLTKLNAQNKMQTEKKTLEQQIADLRAVVPKEPSLDLLMRDLENMCRASQVDLVGVENPEQGTDAA